MSASEPHTQARSSESMILAAWTDPIIASTASLLVPAPTASKFSRELEDIRVAEALVSCKHKRRAAKPLRGLTR